MGQHKLPPGKTPVMAVNAGDGWKVFVLPKLKELPPERRAALLKMESVQLSWRDEPMSLSYRGGKCPVWKSR